MFKFDLFTSEAEKGLSIAMGLDADFIIDEVNKGGSQLYKIDGSFLITRLEIVHNKKQLVIVCYEGEKVFKAVNWIIKQAKKHGIHSLRAHTKNEKFGRLIKNKIGAKLDEQIYILEF